jgi:hypothetical protein
VVERLSGLEVEARATLAPGVVASKMAQKAH